MKKIFILGLICFSSITSFAQHWDNLKQYTNINSDIDVDSHGNILRTEIDYTLNKDYVILTKYKDFCKWDVDSTLIIDYDIVWKDNKQYTVPIYSKQYEVFHTKTLEEIKMPKVVYNEYNKGCNLSIAGNVSISIGLPCLIAGVACSFSKNYKTVKTGAILLGIGGFTTSVGISLDIWGSHLKHSANRSYEIYNLLNSK